MDTAQACGETAKARVRRHTLVLVGLMGAGKTTVGRRLAQALDLPFADADHEIEVAAGCSISDIFAQFGEAAFRDGERRVIARLLEDGPQVVATGGGAFMHAETRAVIAHTAVSVWLQADLDVLVRRVSRRNHRPLLRSGDPRQILERLLREREPVYALADVTVMSDDGPHAQLVHAIISAVDNHLAGRSEAEPNPAQPEPETP